MLHRLVVPAVVLVGLLATAYPAAAADSHYFPAGREGYHTYAETEAFLDRIVSRYGSGSGKIVKRYLIGHSYEGRNIWALKISDHPGLDENEPEVLSESLMHAREHISLEMNIYLIKLLTSNYGASTTLGRRVTQIVNNTEIWVIPMVNPDGAEYDILNGTWHNWRKNRQPNPGSNAVGIDLNRNWSFMWGCCGGSSGKPSSARYRGQYPFESVEDQVLRDFVLSRRVNGVQQISEAFNWHSYGEHILWPYGYTKEDVPPTMTVDDHTALVAMARKMAKLNGYKAMQGSDMYIYDGDFPAWGYGDQGIFVFTVELYPPWGCRCGGFHPPDNVLKRETKRNREMVLYFLEQAGCVYRQAGLEATYCSA